MALRDLIFIAGMVLVCGANAVEASPGKGPVQVYNRFPPHLMFLTPGFESPGLVPAGKINLSVAADYSSVYVNEKSRTWSVLMDMEMAVFDLGLEYGVLEWFSLSMDLPFASMNSGFLDGFIEGYHDAFGLAGYGREGRPENKFAYYMHKDGRKWFRSESGGIHMADASLCAKIPLLEEKRGSPLAASFSYRIKFPCGNEEKGLGSGGLDHGFFVSSKFTLGPVITYLSPGMIMLSDPHIQGMDISLNNIYSLFAGWEYILNEEWSLLAQLNYYTSPFRDTGIPQLDENTMEMSLGFIYELTGGLQLEFAFCEDLTRSAPDFNLHLGLNLLSGLW